MIHKSNQPTKKRPVHFRSYIKSEAVLKIMEYIDLPFPQLAFFLHFVPLFVRDFVYENIADNRYAVFGRSESCEI
ncbi:putative DCC1-like thiol-disulfide oxidoreductase family [Helianthus annuus]|nr:putative DCC1-like thiol-disulfide oxidoreductase family [Helianthus annuus]